MNQLINVTCVYPLDFSVDLPADSVFDAKNLCWMWCVKLHNS